MKSYEEASVTVFSNIVRFSSFLDDDANLKKERHNIKLSLVAYYESHSEENFQRLIVSATTLREMIQESTSAKAIFGMVAINDCDNVLSLGHKATVSYVICNSNCHKSLVFVLYMLSFHISLHIFFLMQYHFVVIFYSPVFIEIR